MHRLGGHVLGFSDSKMTRAGDFYQESMKDTVLMLESYGDVIAMRHYTEGAPAEAASSLFEEKCASGCSGSVPPAAVRSRARSRMCAASARSQSATGSSR